MTRTIDIPTELITPQLLARYDQPGPRYTSYPTAVEFHEGYTSADYLAQLQRADKEASKPFSLYVHIPFCRARCNFCGCNTVVCDKSEIADTYLSYLHKEIDMVAAALPNRRRVVQYHFGGGTPTFLNEQQMTTLDAHIRDTFDIADDCEQAIEVNPAVTSFAQIEMLAALGFNRLSCGVQDFNEDVLAAIGRVQTREEIVSLIEKARSCGFKSVNMDLIYGLPLQTEQNFAKTLKEVAEVRPDRVALYSFAFIPWIRENQHKIDKNQLPGRETKFALFAAALKTFGENGYRQIGMDHFALAEDEMGQAVQNGTLFRNFMGYTVVRSPDMIGLGASSIGFSAGGFAQNHKDLETYYRHLDESRFATEKGYTLKGDDPLRQYIITELMCNFKVDIKTVETKFNIRFADYFQKELAALKAQRAESHPFTEIDDAQLRVTPIGTLFLRNICMNFDAYLKTHDGQRPLFSRTV